MSDLIFKPAEPLADVQARCAAELAAMTNTLAMATPDTYAELYSEGIERLHAGDMLTLEQAAARTGMTPEEYEAKAEKGDAILIAIEGVKAVPDWSIAPDGSIDPMKLDIAREIGRHAQASKLFSFIEYLDFMTDEEDITAEVARGRDMKALLLKAGERGSPPAMLDLVELRQAHPAFQGIVAHRLESLLTYGGWNNEGSLISQDFLDKYAAPGKPDWIFEPVPPLAARLAAQQVKIDDPASGELRESYQRSPNNIPVLYREWEARLAQDDMMSVAEAAAQLGLTSEEYETNAKAGKIILLQVENTRAVPAWSLTGDAWTRELKRDIGREFSRAWRDDPNLPFTRYLHFMTQEKADIAPEVGKELAASFAQAGLDNYHPDVSFKVPMVELIDSLRVRPALFKTLISYVHGALIHGGQSSGPDDGLSPEFAAKYGVPAARSDRSAWLRSKPAP